jgi:hypothetical protein
MTPKSLDRKFTALLQRQTRVNEAVREQRKQQRVQAAKDRGRLALIVGRALLKAAEHPDFELMLKGVLKTTIAEGSAEHKFLASKGWL